MPVAQNLSTLDIAGGGSPFVSFPASTTTDPDGLDLTYGGAPFYASLGAISTSVMRATQIVTEFLRDATDPGGGNLRASQIVLERLAMNSENIYISQVAVERLSAFTANVSTKGKSWMVFDEVNYLDVYISYGTAPTSAADNYAVLNGTNCALWGDELIGFRDVTSLGGSRYRLSGLLRGRWGTEWAMNSHTTTDPFLLLTQSTIKRVTQDSADIGINDFYRAVTLGQSIDTGISRGFANTAKGLKPYAPCFVTGARDGGLNLTITWYRRARYGAEWRDAVEIPIGEESEAYEVDILSSTGTVLRTITDLTSPTATYSAADQTTDFGATQSSIAIVVYQLSSVVGRGYGTTVTV